MNIGIVCYPTYGGSGVVATELGKALANNGHQVHFIAYREPARLLDTFNANIFYHEVSLADYPLFDYAPMWLHQDGIARTTRWERDDHGGMPLLSSVIEQIAESTSIDPQEIKIL